jgi:group II intron reverse transcriptase/maturase
MCENSCDNKIGKRCYSDIKCQGAHETSIHGLKHCEFYTPLELIRKNLIETSLPRQREPINNAFLWFADEVSNVSFGMKAHLYTKTSVFFFLKLGTTSNGYVLLHSRFSRQEAHICYCQRTHGRTFCTSKISTNSSFDSSRTEDTIDVEKEGGNNNLTKSSIVGRDLTKRLATSDSLMDITQKLTTFKIDKCGKYINITKELLCDPDFLRLAYSKIKSNKGVNTKAADNETLDGISSEWFDKAANLIKSSQYKFKPARMKDIPKANSNEKRIITITNSRDKIIQKAIALVLEMIYEKGEVFLGVSHGFRPNKGCHTALKQIKYGWSEIPWYIEADVSKAFDDINRNILINLLKKKISDKRFLDLIFQMYKVDILNLQGFWLKKKNGIMQGNVLSPILCNIYLHQLDCFVINEVINKYKKGDRPVINQEYRKLIGLKEHEKRLPQHIQKTITRSRRRQIDKRGIKRVVESEEYIRIKYVRYADDFIIGVRGSKELAEKVCRLTKNYLSSVLGLKLNMDKTLITNTYAGKVKFLGFEIFNKSAIDLPYRNSREIENYKRVKKKNKIIKQNITNKIKKKTREKVLKWIDREIADGTKENLKETLTPLGKLKIRNKIREIENIIHEEAPRTCEIVEKESNLTVKKIEINRPEILRRIHLNLLNHGAVTTTTARGFIKSWKSKVEVYLKNRKLTYCPEIIELNDVEKSSLVLSKEGLPYKKTSCGDNLLSMVKILYSRQEKLPEKDRITFMESKSSLARINILNEGVRMAIRPIIKINKKKSL